MKMTLKMLVLLIFSSTATAQTDYSRLTNWYFHPDKPINFISTYDLDIAVINPDLSIDRTIDIPNNSKTNTGIDVFWVHPTQLTNPPTLPTTVALDDQPSTIIALTILVQGGLLAKYGRFFAPRYRQATPAAFLNPSYSDEVRATTLMTTYADIKAAFLDYLEHHNKGNKIILAGHSQGSFLLGMLLRDVFDNNPELRSKLLTASLPGKPYLHTATGYYVGGQWENIPLCTTMEQCGCIHTWRSFKETQELPDLARTLPVFNPALVDEGVVYRNVDLTTDWFVQDSLYYNSTSSPLRYYIAPDANYKLGGGANYIAFDSLYTARFKRTSPTKIALAVDYTTDPNDQRPNDLLATENSTSFTNSGFHSKDYHIYLWALLQQIDAKISGCNSTATSVVHLPTPKPHLDAYPNPSNGMIRVDIKRPIEEGESLLVVDIFGRIVQEIVCESTNQIYLNRKGIYFVITRDGTQKIIVE